MKQNRIKLIAVLLLAVLFMLAFTCCVNKSIDSDSSEVGKLTLFKPPVTQEAETTTEDPSITTSPIVTMPPIVSSSDTSQSSPPVTTRTPETTKPEDTVYSGFSGLY